MLPFYSFRESLSNSDLGQNSEIEIESEETKILNLTFLTLVGTEWYLEPLIPPPMPLYEGASKEDSIKYKLEEEKIIEKNKSRKLDTSRLVVFFKDSLIAYPELFKKTELLTPKVFKLILPVDSSYIPLLKKLYTLNKSKLFNLERITDKGKYEIYPFNKMGKIEGDYKSVGKIRYSQIAFSKNRDKACFYFDFSHSPLNGYGLIVFLERKQEKWIIIGKSQMWIA